MDKGPTKTELMSRLKRGAEITLPNEKPAVFLEFCKGSRTSAWVLVGGLAGPKKVESVQGIVKATFGEDI